jgi:ribosomal protein L31E
MQHGALITREAGSAIMELKEFVDRAAERLRVAERETVSAAISSRHDENPLQTLRDAAEALQSPNFEAALRQAKEKMQNALNWHVGAREI